MLTRIKPELTSPLRGRILLSSGRQSHSRREEIHQHAYRGEGNSEVPPRDRPAGD